MMTDPIADMLTRIRNAYNARLLQANVPASRIKLKLAEILQSEGYIDDVRVEETKPVATLHLALKYGRDRGRALAGVRRLSRPGRRLYVGHSEIPKVCNGLGVAILSTSRGVMTDREARAKRVGGELLCEVW
ncbi:MAG: 30S ribosomal protein S8 [Polyangiales bacterium]